MVANTASTSCQRPVGAAARRDRIVHMGQNRAPLHKTRREYIHVGSEQTSLFATVL